MSAFCIEVRDWKNWPKVVVVRRDDGETKRYMTECTGRNNQAIAATVGETCTMELLPDEPTASIQPMRCTACGHKTYAQLANYCPHCGRSVVE